MLAWARANAGPQNSAYRVKWPTSLAPVPLKQRSLVERGPLGPRTGSGQSVGRLRCRSVAGLVEIMLGVWAIGYPGRSAALLIIWVGFGAIVRGVAEIVSAFRVRRWPVEVAA